ncbi:putative C26F1.08c-like protein [Cladobotryum mycophilum]|uniref:C26F1.08c-like protein n=1 Tax=Cladobotryum mycophilum TaxID=491253 RepID=A0ABR0S5N3_9HYPO
MSSGGSSPTISQWPPSRPSKRSKMRNGTFIIPRTGERSRRQFTLRSSRNRSTGDGADGRTSANTSIENASESLHALGRKIKRRFLAVWKWLQSDDGRQVLKCTLAYLLGSTATLWAPLASFLGHRDGKHIVATMTVYFHPARTVGSMIQSVGLAVLAVVYAELICLLSMIIAVISRALVGSATPAHSIVLIVCIGGGLGFLGWIKQRLNQPLVNTATTLASIAIISVITQEEAVQNGYFSGQKIFQMLKMLVLGISFTLAVNLLVWRVSARRVLRDSLFTASVALSDRLSFITRGFLDGSEEDINSPEYAEASIQYNSAYGQMTGNLQDAKLEHYFLGDEKIYPLDERLVKSLESISRTVGGLRSALSTQFTLLKEGQEPTAEPETPLSPESTPPVPRQLASTTDNATTSTGNRLAVIEEDADERFSNPFSRSDPTLDRMPIFRAPSDIFSLFMALLGPSMKSLAYTLSEILRENPFSSDPERRVIADDQLRQSLRDALDLYNNTRGSALQELYRSIELGRARSAAIQADIEEVAAACGHFSFSLQAVAEEIDSYLDALEDLEGATEIHVRSWEWIKFWRYWGCLGAQENGKLPDVEQDYLLPKNNGTGSNNAPAPKGIPKALLIRRDTFNWDASPESSGVARGVSQLTLRVMRFITREDILFGIKVGIGAVLWAMFAFIHATRPVYQHWRGEWGLLSYMIVVGMTTGASNTTGGARFIGTMIGAACACIAWAISQENPWLVALCGSLVALGNFYVILILKRAPLGRISLLAYNIIILYAYSISQSVDDDDDDEGGLNPLIFSIAYHRVIAVTLGILWGIFICRTLWPISARRKFREGLAVLYLQLGLMWKRGPLNVLVDTDGTLDFMPEREQTALRQYAFVLDSLRENASSEFELRGPFPNAAYGRLMHSTRHILNGFYAMRLILQQRRGHLTEGERSLIEMTAGERALLCERICHVFQVLASSIMLEYPITDATPTIDRNRDRLLRKVYKFRKDHMEMTLRNDGDDGLLALADERDYALIYAYTLVTAQVAAELGNAKKEIEGLFGVLDQHELLLE